MSTIETIFLILLVIDAIALGALILLQQGKGADIGAAFGSGAANAMFGGAGSASFLAKATAWLTFAFFALSFGLAYTAKERAASLGDIGVPVSSAPAVPVPANGAAAPASTATATVPANETAPAATNTAAPSTPSQPSDSQTAPKLTAPGEPVDSSVPNV